MRLTQLVHVDGAQVDRGCLDVAVAEDPRQPVKVTTSPKKRCGEEVPALVRMEAGDATAHRVAAHVTEDVAVDQPVTILRYEHVLVLAVRSQLEQELAELRAEGHHANPAALAVDTEGEVLPIDVLPFKAKGFIDAEAGIEQEPHEGLVPWVDSTLLGSYQQPFYLIVTEGMDLCWLHR